MQVNLIAWTCLALSVLSGCAIIPEQPKTIPLKTFLQSFPHYITAYVVEDNVPVVADDHEKGLVVRDVLREGERVLVPWLGEPFNQPQTVYSQRGYLGKVTGESLRFAITEAQATKRLEMYIESLSSRQIRTESEPETEPEKQKKQQFRVERVLPNCKFFVARTNRGYSLVDKYLCSTPRAGATGYGNLNIYSSTSITINRTPCRAWVKRYQLSKQNAFRKQEEKCPEK